jgi:hypothetical protein
MKEINFNNNRSALWPGPGHFKLPGPVGLVHAGLRSDPELSLSGKGSLEEGSVWDELEQELVQLYGLESNRIWRKGKSPESLARKEILEVKSASGGVIQRVEFTGPKQFLRVVGENKVFAGAWWFDIALLDTLEKSYSRIYFNDSEKKQAIRDILREVLALSVKWNRIQEIWMLELPANEKISGFSSHAAPQKLFHDLPLSAMGNRILAGRARQIYFPVKDPFRITRYSVLLDIGVPV